MFVYTYCVYICLSLPTVSAQEKEGKRNVHSVFDSVDINSDTNKVLVNPPTHIIPDVLRRICVTYSRFVHVMTMLIMTIVMMTMMTLMVTLFMLLFMMLLMMIMTMMTTATMMIMVI